MPARPIISRTLLTLLALALPVAAQGAEPKKAPPIEPKVQPKANPKNATSIKAVGKDEQIKVLKPQDVPAELKRLNKSKADIKAEISLRTNRGTPVVFKGVIRNGRFIERIVKSRFRSEQTLAHPRSGLRLWWSGNSDGYIFFRYDSIETLTIVGKLTAKERAELLKRLAAKRTGTEKQAAPKKIEGPDLEKLSPTQLRGYLIATYPYDKGWNHDKKRQLAMRQLVEDKPLTKEETVFLTYFHILAKARFEELQKKQETLEIEPGSANKKPDGTVDGPAGAPSGD